MTKKIINETKINLGILIPRFFNIQERIITRKMKIITKLTNVNPRPDVSGFFKSTLLFLTMLIGEQLSTIVYYTGSNFHLKLVGLIFGILIAWLFIKTAISYQSNYESLQPRKGITKTVVGYVALLYILSVTWGQIGPKLLNLNLNGQTSENQSSVLSFLSDPWSTVFIIIMTVIIAPILEEFCFRYLIIKPKKQNSNIIRLIISVVAFAYLHVGEQLPSVLHHQLTFAAWFFYFTQYALIGIILTTTYNKYRNYKLNVLIHASWNTIAIAIAIVLNIIAH